jgi:hypothetical protein
VTVHEFPKKPDEPPPLLVGPFEEYRVVIDGRRIPKLTGRKDSDGRVHLTVDHRFGAEFPNEETAHQAAWLIAQAMAIGAGYPHLGAETKEQPFAPLCVRLSSVETESPQPSST